MILGQKVPIQKLLYLFLTWNMDKEFHNEDTFR